MNKLYISYNAIKQSKIDRDLVFNYVEGDALLEIFCVDVYSNTIFICNLFKSGTDTDYTTEIADFDTNYKATANEYDSIEIGTTDCLSKWIYAEVSSSKKSQLITPLVHRKNLVFKPIGFYFTTNSASGYTAKTRSANVTQSITAGQNYCYIDSIKWFASGFTIKIKEGATEENLIIASIDLANNKLTFTTNIVNSYTTSADTIIDLVKVSVSGSKTIIDYYVTENNTLTENQGIDINGAEIYGDNIDLDFVNSYAWIPAYTSAYHIAEFIEDLYLFSGDKKVGKKIVAETTTTITPGIVLRLEYNCADANERKIGLILDVWRI